MFDKDIYQITEEDLQELVTGEVLEHKMLEYKQELPGNSDAQKKEFLADVSAFANSSGGIIIYGISEAGNGIPIEVKGIETEDLDKEMARLDSILRTGIEPRIPNISLRPIKLSNGNTALVIKMPKSWQSPHRVIYQDHAKFYGRGSNGKYPLNVAELRTAFTLSEVVAERIRRFREERIANIYANELPIPFDEGAKVVLHIIPVSSFNPGQIQDISKITADPGKLRPIYCRGWNHRHNFDGFLSFSGGKDEISYSYVQLYRSGTIEALTTALLPIYDGQKQIVSIAFEKELINSLASYLSVERILDIQPPYLIFVTLLEVKGYIMSGGDRYFREDYPIDRDILLIPEILVEDQDINTAQILKPAFDAIWNACGYSGSRNYNQEGEWNTK